MSNDASNTEEANLENDPLVKKYASGFDLSEDVELQTQPSVLDSIALEESYARRSRQSHLYGWALFITAVLFIFSGSMSLVLVCKASKDMDWHLPVLVAAFLIPPTLIMIALIRAVYPSAGKSEDKDSLPALNLIKEILLAAKEAAKAVK